MLRRALEKMRSCAIEGLAISSLIVWRHDSVFTPFTSSRASPVWVACVCICKCICNMDMYMHMWCGVFLTRGEQPARGGGAVGLDLGDDDLVA